MYIKAVALLLDPGSFHFIMSIFKNTADQDKHGINA
jgi:hypothetical protein